MTEAGREIEKLLALHPKGFDLSLERITRLLGALGDPHKRLPPVIHVAGTNGKGSVTAFSRAILEAAGLSVHVHTSPHLVSFRERIRVDGEAIAEDAVVDGVESLGTQIARLDATVFEATTALALDHFAQERVDVVLRHRLGRARRLKGSADRFEGLYISDAQAKALASRPASCR